MSTKITITCDRCERIVETKRAKDPEQLWEVGVLAVCKAPNNQQFPNIAHAKGHMYQVKKEHKIEVCRRCIEKMGLVPTPKPEPDAPPPPSIETLIHEIVEESVQNAMDER